MLMKMRKSIAMKMTTVIRATLAVSAMAVVATSCNYDNSTPGYTYMDDMYTSPSLEAYSAANEEILENGMSAQKPVEGTIPRGYHPYEVPNTNEGYAWSKQHNDVVPANFAAMDPAEGKELYTIFCAHCHGDKGDGNGILVQNEKILGVPGYGSDRLTDITPASAYHVVMYGKGVMGSHASQINYEERWKIIRYVWSLRAEQDGTPDIGESVQVEEEGAPAEEAEATHEETEEHA